MPPLLLSYALRRLGRIKEADQAILLAYTTCSNLASLEFESALLLAMDGRLVESRKHFGNYVHLMVEQSDNAKRVPKVDAIFAHFLKENQLPVTRKFHETQEPNS